MRIRQLEFFQLLPALVLKYAEENVLGTEINRQSVSRNNSTYCSFRTMRATRV